MRGVNKLIVEIKDTENEFFDRAILFVKPDKAVTAQSELDKSARKLLSAVKNGAPDKRKSKVWLVIAGGVLVLMAAAAVVVIVALV